MTTESWRCIHSSIAGTTHTASDKPCQDSAAHAVFHTPDGSQILVVVVSDGAGSAKCAEVGSTLVCTLFLKEVKSYVTTGADIQELTADFFKTWLTQFKEAVRAHAAQENLLPRDFAATLLAGIVAEHCAVFIQIGDGAIVTSGDEPQSYGWIFWPQQGEYANQTHFATDPDAEQHMEFAIIRHKIHDVAVFSDGLQSLTLEYQTRQAHAPFFIPVFRWLQGASTEDLEKFSFALASFLDSAKVNDRTDDDKTLILATRRCSLSESLDLNPNDAGTQPITAF